MGLFGIGDGKMDLALVSVDVAPGDKLEGTATLTLNTDVNANGVFATLYAERRDETFNAQGQPMSRNVNIYTNRQKLDEKKRYLKASSPLAYKFSFVIPQTGSTVPQGGAAGTVANLIQGAEGMGMRAGMMAEPVRWFINVTLEIPLAFGISKVQEINIVNKVSQ